MTSWIDNDWSCRIFKSKAFHGIKPGSHFVITTILDLYFHCKKSQDENRLACVWFASLTIQCDVMLITIVFIAPTTETSPESLQAESEILRLHSAIDQLNCTLWVTCWLENAKQSFPHFEEQVSQTVPFSSAMRVSSFVFFFLVFLVFFLPFDLV